MHSLYVGMYVYVYTQIEFKEIVCGLKAKRLTKTIKNENLSIKLPMHIL